MADLKTQKLWLYNFLGDVVVMWGWEAEELDQVIGKYCERYKIDRSEFVQVLFRSLSVKAEDESHGLAQIELVSKHECVKRFWKFLGDDYDPDR